MGTVDIILDVGSASAEADSIFRDSIHVGIGLPSGWEVLSAKACPAPHFRPASASVNLLDTNLRNRLLLDTLAACSSRAAALVSDAGIQAYLKGRTLRASASPDSLGRPFNLRVDTVPQWFGYSGRIDVSVPAGAPADTVLDSTAFKALPVYVYLTLKAPGRDESVRLFYFSKTGRLDTSVFADASNQDKGALVYRPILVGSPTTLRPDGALHASGRTGGFRLARIPAGGYTVLLPAASSPWRGLELRDASGAVLHSWSMESLSGRAALGWDGRDAHGRSLATGLYLLVLTGWQGRIVEPFVVLR